MKKIKIALAQLNIKWEDKLINQKKCQKLVQKAAKQKTDIIIFPEMTLTGFSMNVSKIAEKETESQTASFFQQLAKKYSIAIVFGVVFQKNKKGKNLAVMIDKRGKILAKYQKIHSFRLAEENKYYENGKSLSVFSYCNFKISLLICYDLRFIGLFNSLLKHKPDLVIVIANWPKERIGHWSALLKARALDVQSYVAGVNRTGKSNNLEYNGQSAVFSPKGEILSALGEKNLGLINLDKNKLKAYRKKFPFLLDSQNPICST